MFEEKYLKNLERMSPIIKSAVYLEFNLLSVLEIRGATSRL